MSLHVSYSNARQNFATLCREVIEKREIAIISNQKRRNEDVALIPADELSSILETIHLFKSPENARRLLRALEDSETGKNVKAMTIEELKKDVGLDE
ncbi:MAG: type II toxin-antitoxin system Phd/YefM family antitoxin [bacterium]